MYRIIAAIISFGWGAVFGLAESLVVAMHPSDADNPQRLFAIATFALVPVAGGVAALVWRSSLAVILAWSMVVGMMLQKVQFAMSRHDLTVSTWAMLAVGLVALVVSLLARGEDRDAMREGA